MTEISIMIGFDAGEGAMVTGRIMSKTFARSGLNVIVYPEYPSLVRGGHNAVQIRVSDKDIYGPVTGIDILLASNKKGVFYHARNMKSGGVIICDESVDLEGIDIPTQVHIAKIPFSKMLTNSGASAKMKNVLMVSTILGLIEEKEGSFIQKFKEAIDDEFSRKGKEIVQENLKVADAGYNNAKSLNVNASKLPVGTRQENQIIIAGNEASALGSVASGMKFYAAYPMTPASTLLHHLARIKRKAEIVVKHTEDEISAINYAVGAAYTGVRAMTGTSGGGFALMTETLGMSALAETPLVVYLAQRVGPSTGMPTWTEQGDLKFALNASQGDFLRVVIAPSDVADSFYLMGDAFNLTEKYQLPVLFITDKFLGESAFSVPEFEPDKIKIDRGKIADEKELPELKSNERFKRYKLTEDGVSPRTFPGMKNGIHVASSYTHGEDSFTTESFRVRTEMVDKRNRKKTYLLKDMPMPKVYGPENADITIITWGSQKLPGLDAIKKLNESGIKTNLVVFTFLFPLDEKKHGEFLSRFKHPIMMENNSTSQYAGILREYLGFVPEAYLLRFDGRPHFGDSVAEAVEEWKKSEFENGKKFILNSKEDVEYYYPERFGY